MSVPELKTKQRIGPSSAGILMTPEAFDSITDYDDRYRYELIHGVLVVTPIPSAAEGDPNEELGHLLRSYKEQDSRGAALDKTLPERYILTHDSRCRADRVIWTGLGRVPDAQLDVPSIVVEFVSRARRDRRRDYEEKRRKYLALGVVEYWIVDRFRRVLTVFRNRPGVEAEQVIGENETYRTDLLPGFELPLKQLLAVADDWKR